MFLLLIYLHTSQHSIPPCTHFRSLYSCTRAGLSLDAWPHSWVHFSCSELTPILCGVVHDVRANFALARYPMIPTIGRIMHIDRSRRIYVAANVVAPVDRSSHRAHIGIFILCRARERSVCARSEVWSPTRTIGVDRLTRHGFVMPRAERLRVRTAHKTWRRASYRHPSLWRAATRVASVRKLWRSRGDSARH